MSPHVCLKYTMCVGQRWWIAVTSAWGTAYDDILPVPLPGVLIRLYPTYAHTRCFNKKVSLQWWELLMSHIPLSLVLTGDWCCTGENGQSGGYCVVLVHWNAPPTSFTTGHNNDYTCVTFSAQIKQPQTLQGAWCRRKSRLLVRPEVMLPEFDDSLDTWDFPGLSTKRIQ
jgi:hypothetical protein